MLNHAIGEKLALLATYPAGKAARRRDGSSGPVVGLHTRIHTHDERDVYDGLTRTLQTNAHTYRR
jgi:hypothetical protein